MRLGGATGYTALLFLPFLFLHLRAFRQGARRAPYPDFGLSPFFLVAPSSACACVRIAIASAPRAHGARMRETQRAKKGERVNDVQSTERAHAVLSYFFACVCVGGLLIARFYFRVLRCLRAVPLSDPLSSPTAPPPTHFASSSFTPQRTSYTRRLVASQWIGSSPFLRNQTASRVPLDVPITFFVAFHFLSL